MRFIYAFVALAAASSALASVQSGDLRTMAIATVLALVAGALTWREVRNPEVLRKGGERVSVTFTFQSEAGVENTGTSARVRAHNRAWAVALDRAPERADQDIYDVSQGGWVWLGPDNLPEKVRINYGPSWKSWTVRDAAVLTQSQGSGK